MDRRWVAAHVVFPAKTERGEGMYRVIRTDQRARNTGATRKTPVFASRRRRKGYARHACIATYTDRQEILTHAQVAAMLSEIGKHTS